MASLVFLHRTLRLRRKPTSILAFIACMRAVELHAQAAGNDPWENAVNVLRTAFTGSIATGLSLVAIFDVGQSGDTQKPFGRIFYTKDRSLIFYGYDLDQQRGVKKNASFQAWGRRDGDRKPDVSLGVFYQDDAGNKRWILKFNDPSLLEQLDAVFITAEPRGGSSKPTGKPLLFTYLRIDPNHP